MDIDLSILQDFEVEDKDWMDWNFKHDLYENIPLTFFNKFNRMQAKCCDLSNVSSRKDD